MPTDILWKPSAKFMNNSRLRLFELWLKENRNLSFHDYESLWEWSVSDVAAFWECIWEYFEVISHAPYHRVMSDQSMPGVKWFEGATLNYAEHIFRQASDERPAILYATEHGRDGEMSWEQLSRAVASFQQWLISQGVGKNDCVVAFLPNIPEATIAWLATIGLGAVWSSCSPDFGASSVIDRFEQIRPKVLITTDGYFYNGKPFNRLDIVRQIREKLGDLKATVCIPYLNDAQKPFPDDMIPWEHTQQKDINNPIITEPLLFDHPIWVLYSSGTTGIPKAITHSHGGVLLEHLRYLAFHNDCHAGERFFWYSTTGWMMWNFTQAALLTGATIVLYDGSAAYPDLGAMWKLAERFGIHHFGTSAPYLTACMKKGLVPGKTYDLSSLRSIGSTGAPLPPEAFNWVYDAVKSDLWLCSMSGGTDVCTAFVGGSPYKPVRAGEIQCRTLGCSLYALNDDQEAVTGQLGEMVITKPMPSMPVYFWNDPDMKRYTESYFEMYPGLWRHGDWMKLNEDGTMVIYGRSDATLNRQGVRIGTAEVYRAVDQVEAVEDSIILNLELDGGRHFMPLFVKMKPGATLNNDIESDIKQRLKTQYSPRHVPDIIISVPDIPYTISGKKLEAPVKKILMGLPPSKAANKDALRNPGALEYFIRNRVSILDMA